MTPSTRSIRTVFLGAAAALALAACARDATTPAAQAPAAHASAAAVGGSYIFGFGGSGIPGGFASQAAALGGTVTFSHPGSGIAVVSGLTDASATQLGAATGAAEVQPDAQVQLAAPVAPVDGGEISDAAESATNPTTASRYAWQWNMRLIHASTAWAAGKLGSATVTAAILDTGIDYDAPDLNGLVDLSRSTSFATSDAALAGAFPTRHVISDFNGHGTNVATQVSSKAAALAGVTSRTTLIGVKVLDSHGSGSLSWILNGVIWAADHGADVANMSLGGAFPKSLYGPYVGVINRTFGYAARKGMLVVVAAGNEEEDLDHNGNEMKTYCGVPTVLCVSAVGPASNTTSADAFSYYSNFGRSSIDVAGPGGNADAANGFPAYPFFPSIPQRYDVASWVWSYCSKTTIVWQGTTPYLTNCYAGGRLTGMIGTSQATPHVTGLAALLIAELGKGQPRLIKNRIQQSAIDLGQPGTDPYFGAGRIDVARALGL